MRSLSLLVGRLRTGVGLAVEGQRSPTARTRGWDELVMDPAGVCAANWRAFNLAAHFVFERDHHSLSAPTIFASEEIARNNFERPTGKQFERKLCQDVCHRSVQPPKPSGSVRHQRKTRKEGTIMGHNQVKEKWRPGMTIPMKVVRPGFLQVQQQEDSLWSDLMRMGCESFLEVPWDITDKDIVAEIATHQPVAEFKNHPLRAQSENWTEAHWQNTYRFPAVTAGYDKVTFKCQ